MKPRRVGSSDVQPETWTEMVWFWVTVMVTGGAHVSGWFAV